MKQITDFDPLRMLEELQQGFVLLSENQQALNLNQQRLNQAMDLLCETLRRLDARQDLLAEVMGLVKQAQKTPETDLHK